MSSNETHNCAGGCGKSLSKNQIMCSDCANAGREPR